MKTRPTFRRHLRVPIYPAHLYLVVSEDARAAARFGPFDDSEIFGMCSNRGSVFGLFFTPKAFLQPGTVAHEVFHLTVKILAWSDVVVSDVHSEAGAYLHGHLFEQVWNWRKTYFGR